VEGNLLCRMVVVGDPEVVGDVTFIRLNVTARLASSAEEGDAQ
jgi:hypothetical protein